MGVNYRVLADQIGNLLSRISSPRILGKMAPFAPEDRDADVDQSLNALRDTIAGHMESYLVSRACDSILDVVSTVSPDPCFLNPSLCPRAGR